MPPDTAWYDQHLPDHGPVYMETDPGRFIVEPWNALSSLLIVIPALIWLYRIKGQYRENLILIFAIPLIILGGLGSTLFHGFRFSPFFLFMDIIPSAILVLTLTIYLWLKILKSWGFIFLIMIPLFSVRFLFWGSLPHHLAINISYFISGFAAALPLVVIMFRTRFRKWKAVAAVIVSFILALVFRELDTFPVKVFPMGTHFLWHAFSGLGAYFILDYLYYIGKENLKSS